MKYGLRHRIIGAIILLSLAVIFLPMILDGGQRPLMPVDTAAMPALPAKPDLKVKDPKPEVRPDIVAAAPEREKGMSGLTEQHHLAAWTLQAATFKDQASAIRLRDRLRERSIRSYVRDRSPFFVVYAGPFADPKQAAQIKAQLSRDFRIDALQLSFDPMAEIRIVE